MRKITLKDLCVGVTIVASLILFLGAGVTSTRGQGANDARYAVLTGPTFTGVVLIVDGSDSAPAMALASNPDTGFYLAKASPPRFGISFDDVLVTTFDATKGIDTTGSGTFGTDLSVKGNTTVGDDSTDTVTFNGDTWSVPNGFTATVGSDLIFDVGGGLFRAVAQAEIEGSLEVQGKLQMTNGRFNYDKGADIASADELTLGSDGNYFDITGTTTINGITKSLWPSGSVVVLQFDASVTVTHNDTPAGTEAAILLSGAGNFSATAGDTLQLFYDGTTWREVSRTVI